VYFFINPICDTNTPYKKGAFKIVEVENSKIGEQNIINQDRINLYGYGAKALCRMAITR